MECERCGHSMMQETVIRLRRSLFGFRETRLPGAYCWGCKAGAVLEEPSLGPASAATGGELFATRHRKMLPMWRFPAVRRFGSFHPTALPAREHLSALRS